MAKMTRHQLKQDELRNFGDQLGEWFEKHSNLFTTIIVVVLLCFAGWKGYERYVDSRAVAAGTDLGALLRNYSEGVAATDAAKRKELLATAETDAQRLETGFGSLYTARAGKLLSGNAKYFEAMLTDTSAATSATQDELRSAREKSLKDARTTYENYSATAKTEEERAIAQLALGQTLENLLFLSENKQSGVEAIEAYKLVDKLAPKTYLAAEAKFGLARLAQAQTGRQQEAAQLYDAVIAERKTIDPTLKDTAETTGTKDNKKAEILRPIKDQRGQLITVEQIKEIRSFEHNTYAWQAAEALKALRGLPTEAKKQ